MRGRRRWDTVLALAVVILVIGATVRSSYVLGMLTFVALYAIAALGLSLVMGFAGQVSLGQAAFYAIGAYVSGKGQMTRLEWLAATISGESRWTGTGRTPNSC